ncbi:MAG: hypothetical protein KME27_23160 [Lyngbya sp. HA4199-MV5]|jgi:hypothetical protein|nr:hypothetical protein [Lyngbya sp. HA4199-MV5]
MEQAIYRTKNTSFSTDPATFRLAKQIAALDDISLSELVHIALTKELKARLAKHKQNQQLMPLLMEPQATASAS